MKTLMISQKVFARFTRIYNKHMTSKPVIGHDVSALQFTNKINNKIVVSCKYEKIGSSVIKTFFYNRIK